MTETPGHATAEAYRPLLDLMDSIRALAPWAWIAEALMSMQHFLRR